MRNFKLSIIVLLGSLFAIVSSSQEVDQSSLLDRPAKGANLNNVITGQAVINALLDAGVPGGMANVSECNDATYSFRPHDSSLRGVLDSIVSADPRYTWEIKDEVVNVIPSDGLPPFFAVRISRLDIAQVESLEEALSQLLAVPEVQQTQVSLGARFVQGGAYPFCPEGCAPKEKAKEISISLRNVTVRESLNALARVNGNAVWRFRQSECGGRKYFSLDFASK
jgi:hypothetical protein